MAIPCPNMRRRTRPSSAREPSRRPKGAPWLRWAMATFLRGRKPMHDAEHAEPLSQLRKMVKGIRFAMLTTEDREGHLRSRPMAARDLDEDGAFWFFTGKSTSKVDEIGLHQEVNLAFVDEKDNRFV